MSEQVKYRGEHGPKVVAIGGGTGLSTMLRGLKGRVKDLTAIVTVADDGGGSGVLRKDLGMPPPGDIRHCMEALANAEPIMQELLAYRFPVGSGRLTGQSFGNLILAALNGVTGSFEEAVAQMSQVLAITGRILPVTSADVKLEATFENGTAVVGESLIADFKKAQDCRIRKVRLLPERPAATLAALEAIREANLIVLGPGSLYTSVIPNLLVEGVAEAICQSSALKIYIGNIMTQDGETEGMTLSDHVSALLAHSGPGLIDLCVANSAPVDPALIQRYKAEDADPIVVDKERIEALGVEVVERPMISVAARYARHSPERLGEVTMELYEERADTKVF